MRLPEYQVTQSCCGRVCVRVEKREIKIKISLNNVTPDHIWWIFEGGKERPFFLSLSLSPNPLSDGTDN